MLKIKDVVYSTSLLTRASVTRIEDGDLTALEAKYHLTCLTSLRNRYRSLLRQRQSSHSNLEESQIDARVFVELFTHVENAVADGSFCFKFSSLRQMYENRLGNLGISKEVNKVRFKERVLEYFSNSQEHNDGKNVLLVFEQGMQQMLKKSVGFDYQEDMLILMKAARIVRNDIFLSSGFNFNASRPQGCQKESLPMTLKLLVTMLLRGSDILDQDSSDSQVCLTVAQTFLTARRPPRRKLLLGKVDTHRCMNHLYLSTLG